MWDREEEYFLQLWNVQAHGENTVRSAFQGETKPSPVDSNMKEAQVPAWEYTSKVWTSGAITISLALAMGAWIFLWVSMFDGKMTTVALLLLVLQIKVFEFIFNKISIELTKWENHKFRENYYNNLLWKVFCFQMVNQYWPFIYLSVQQRRTSHGCPEGGCLHELRGQLGSSMVILAAASIAQVVFKVLVVRLRLWWETRRVTCSWMPTSLGDSVFGASRPLGREDSRSGGDAIVSRSSFAPAADGTRAYVEEQAKYGTFDIEDQVMAMVQSTITLGYVILFGPVAPVVVPLCFLVLMIEVRGTAFYLTTTARRPFPANALGRCAWQQVVQKLMRVGVLWTGILLAEFGYLLRGQAVIAKVTFVFLFCISMVAIWEFIDLVYSKDSTIVRLMVLRRKRVLDCLAAECAEAVEQKAREARSGEETVSLGATRTSSELLCKEGKGEDDDMVEVGDWDGIQAFSEAVAAEEQLKRDGSPPRLERTNTFGDAGEGDGATLTSPAPIRKKSLRGLARLAVSLGKNTGTSSATPRNSL
jgi:hypothetical protein